MSIAIEARSTASTVLLSISVCHFINDLLQSLLPALYPLLQQSLSLSFAQIGMLTFAMQASGSVLQPIVGVSTDRRFRPYLLAAGMGFTLAGIALMASARVHWLLMLAALLLGVGSSIFHPESSRVARMASGGRHGLAQSIFQVGGNVGSAIGPLLVALVVLPLGQWGVAWFVPVAALGIVLLVRVGHWCTAHAPAFATAARSERSSAPGAPHRARAAIAILLALIFSKYLYITSLTSFYTLYLIERFGVSIRASQLLLFLFLASAAAGTLIGGPVGDRFGRRRVIWLSIFGVLPFTLLLPHANLVWTAALTVPIGMILASAFPAIVVYAQELMPGRTGAVSGLFFGFAFGVAGLGAVALGWLGDATSLGYLFELSAYLPMLGMLAVMLPKPERPG
jgi:FSR family fosmidomycin resistance protein-like MFS transporter